MPKKAIIYDLDNTIYPVSSIGEKLFSPLFRLIEESRQHTGDMEAIKNEVMRTPFRLVAKQYGLNDELTKKAIAIQENIIYEEPIATFEDYPEIKNIEAERFLVTTGFEKMQRSKITQMGIEADFKEIHIVNPTLTSKKQVFEDILKRHGYMPEEMLVVGDDPESEIKAAYELGIETVLYNKFGWHSADTATYAINHFRDLKDIVRNS